MTHFSPNSVAGCISNVECGVGGNLELRQTIVRGIFIFGGGNKRLRNVTKLYCQCQISHKRRKKECLG
jgi:hypothetical protein